MRVLLALLVLAAIAAAGLLWRPSVLPSSVNEAVVAEAPIASENADAVWAISFVRARPGQRERLERYLKANWLALDDQALQQKRIRSYRMLRADPDPRGTTWDFAVTIEYADRQAMSDFVPFYLELTRGRAHVRVDGLDFADLGEVVQQKTVTPLAYDAVHE